MKGNYRISTNNRDNTEFYLDLDMGKSGEKRYFEFEYRGKLKMFKRDI